MEKLPVTSYIRSVDIWLIFGQLIPFIMVINYLYKKCEYLTKFVFIKVVLFTIRELFNENDFINHHGPKISVNKKDGFFPTPSLWKDINFIAKFFGKSQLFGSDRS